MFIFNDQIINIINKMMWYLCAGAGDIELQKSNLDRNKLRILSNKISTIIPKNKQFFLKRIVKKLFYSEKNTPYEYDLDTILDYPDLILILKASEHMYKEELEYPGDLHSITCGTVDDLKFIITALKKRLHYETS